MYQSPSLLHSLIYFAYFCSDSVEVPSFPNPHALLSGSLSTPDAARALTGSINSFPAAFPPPNVRTSRLLSKIYI